ncbi:Spy/CpxP family protein refolding chaperone [Thermodesulfobacteriota bacterium]
MLNRSLPAIGVLLVVMAAALTWAEEVPPGRWWHDSRVDKRLNLTEEEKGQLDGLFVENRRKLIDLKSALERERFELETVLEDRGADAQQVRERYKSLETARARLSNERFSFLLEVRRIVGPERFQQLSRLYHQAEKQKEHRRRDR